LSKQWWDKVRVTPEVTNNKVFNNGNPQGVGSDCIGGHVEATATDGERLK